MKANVIRGIRRVRLLSRISAVAIAGILLLGSLLGSPPEFAKFPVSSIFTGPAAKPKFQVRIGHMAGF